MDGIEKTVEMAAEAGGRPSGSGDHGGLLDCFDARRAAWPTCVVGVSEIVDLLSVTHARERVEEYRQAMQRGDRFPPVSVVRLAGRLFLADGHKRYSAYRTRAATEILVEVWPLRRWLHDQWRQLLNKTAQQVTLVVRATYDRRARQAATRLFWDTVGHWQRAVRSLRNLAAQSAVAETDEWRVVAVLRGGSGVRAVLQVVERRGQRALRKDFSSASPCVRRTTGALMMRRERAAYRRLDGVPGVPRLLGPAGCDGLLLEHIQGRDATACAPTAFTAAFFDELHGILANLRARGVLHGDVKRNVMRTAEGRPVLFDFGASFVIRWWLWPVRGLLLRTAAGYDARAVAKLKRQVAPQLLTPGDGQLLAASMPFEALVELGERVLQRGIKWVLGTRFLG
jgi:hypothetical protein